MEAATSQICDAGEIRAIGIDLQLDPDVLCAPVVSYPPRERRRSENLFYTVCVSTQNVHVLTGDPNLHRQTDRLTGLKLPDIDPRAGHVS